MFKLQLKKNDLSLYLIGLLYLLSPIPSHAETTIGSDTHYNESISLKTTEQTKQIEQLDTVTVNATAIKPSSLPMHIPNVFESVDKDTIQTRINAVNSSDALKYLPSLNVRKRYIGDYNHAVLGSLASGTGNSARSLVYTDGILLSNLLGNGATYTPRWGLITPNEIERVNVLYGPFSAAYSGNSMGSVVDYQTRMPKTFEGEFNIQSFNQVKGGYQPNSNNKDLNGMQTNGSMGSKIKRLSWFINAEYMNNNSQPLSLVTRLNKDGILPNQSGVTVSGAITGLSNPQQVPWVILGTTGQFTTKQANFKIKLGYELTPYLNASYTLGVWDNQASSAPYSYLTDAANNRVYTGSVIINQRQYALNTNDFSYNQSQLQHIMQGFALKNTSHQPFNWEIAASNYRYKKDLVRGQSTLALPQGQFSGPGRITDLSGSGWSTINTKGIWQMNPVHLIEFGLQQERYQSRTWVFNTNDWLHGAPTTQLSKHTGDTQLNSLWIQDNWEISPVWNMTLGLRQERWKAYQGSIANANKTIAFGVRSEQFLSPKWTLSHTANKLWTFKANIGRAVRMPTATELYQGSINNQIIVNNDPFLKPEMALTQELTAERHLNNGTLRMSWFNEKTRNALYNQTNYMVNPMVTNIQNVDKILTQGVELSYQAKGIARYWITRPNSRLDITANLTYADSVIAVNQKNPLSQGKEQPRVPNWRANLLLSYAFSPQLLSSIGIRYSGKQYGQLDNSDTNSRAYLGFSPYTVTDIKTQYQLNKRMTLSAGIDNIANETYWAFHPYPQRTIYTQLKYRF